MSRFHGDSHTRLYHIWAQMKSRCTDQSMPNRIYYYERGITVCDEWKDNWLAFKEWSLSHGYDDSLSLDRIDGDKGYSPDNCRWATQEKQMNNVRSNVNLTYNGKTQSMAKWAREVGIPASTLRNRVNAGWDDEKVLTYPVDTSKRKKKVRGV